MISVHPFLKRKGIEADSDVAYEKSSGVMNDVWLSIAGTFGSLPGAATGGFLRR